MSTKQFATLNSYNGQAPRVFSVPGTQHIVTLPSYGGVGYSSTQSRGLPSSYGTLGQSYQTQPVTAQTLQSAYRTVFTSAPRSVVQVTPSPYGANMNSRASLYN